MKTGQNRAPEGDGIHLTAAELIALRPRCQALRLPMRQPAASALAGAYRSRFRGRGVDFLESRNYQPGDDIRNMDWRVTARTGKAYTKVFQEERERPVLVVLDASPSLYFGTRQRLKSVVAGQMAAAIAWAAIRRGDRIGGFLFAPGRHREMRPAGGRRGAMRMIQGLVDWLGPEQGGGHAAEPLSAALERVRHAARPGSLVIVISDFFGMDEACNRHLSRLRQHNDVIGCQVLDAAEYRLPDGRYPISDGENAAVLDMSLNESKSRYDTMVLRHLDEPRRMFQKHQCGWLVLHTDDDPVDVLGRELRLLVGRPV
ncbi:MAG: DUF58 domain-containing protein [Xanthomonadales bacterium]|nr:DUF58 domain-containing protein [Gammaproteobacteria bacterium]MBT8054215.1 DUF58 domain-containing protein [Gammaproteobacteria bacterium]NND57592.1 DUF58 domain-containing protein [Xanthomonadales bacterium]NNK51316.1 DUF58 domain-containing protein [Xanthomonadales bacterium]